VLLAALPLAFSRYASSAAQSGLFGRPIGLSELFLP